VKVAYSPRAFEDLAEIAAYLRPLNPSAATRVKAAILATVQILSVFPGTGARTRLAAFVASVFGGFRIRSTI